MYTDMQNGVVPNTIKQIYEMIMTLEKPYMHELPKPKAKREIVEFSYSNELKHFLHTFNFSNLIKKLGFHFYQTSGISNAVDLIFEQIKYYEELMGLPKKK